MSYTTVNKVLVAALFSVALSCEQPLEQERNTMTEAPSITKTFHRSHYPKKKDAPFSDVVEVGNTYFLSGQIGMDHHTRTLVEGGIEAETHQTIKNIEEVLAQHQLRLADVVKVMVVLKDMNDFSTFNAIYTQYFPQRPARTTFAAQALAAGAMVEIEVIAVRDN